MLQKEIDREVAQIRGFFLSNDESKPSSQQNDLESPSKKQKKIEDDIFSLKPFMTKNSKSSAKDRTRPEEVISDSTFNQSIQRNNLRGGVIRSKIYNNRKKRG